MTSAFLELFLQRGQLGEGRVGVDRAIALRPVVPLMIGALIGAATATLTLLSVTMLAIAGLAMKPLAGPALILARLMLLRRCGIGRCLATARGIGRARLRFTEIFPALAPAVTLPFAARLSVGGRLLAFARRAVARRAVMALAIVVRRPTFLAASSRPPHLDQLGRGRLIGRRFHWRDQRHIPG